MGSRTYQYVTAFLSNRTVEIHLGSVKSPTFTLGSRGTPQGAVLSPFLFNITLIPLAQKLSTIPALQHSLYADDITLWTTTGNCGTIEYTLQRATKTVQEHARSIGLSCSAPKSELLLIRPKDPFPPAISIYLDDQLIPQVNNIRVLGLHISNNGSNSIAIGAIRRSVQYISALIKRISNRHRGMREADTRRLVQAFCLCKMTYSLPYLHLSSLERDQVDRLIRTAYKTAMHLPKSTATSKLLQLGVHNTIDELVEAHLISHYTRLSQSETGRLLLQRLKINLIGCTTPTNSPPECVSDSLFIPPLPKNTHPTHNHDRRMARARSLHKRYASSTPVAYVDAAEYSHRPAFAVAVSDNAHKLLCCATFDRVAQPIEAEEAAIALAIAHTQAEYIFSDSKTAIRNFAMRRIHAPAYRILQFVPPPKRIITILWVPAHCGHPGNTAAHEQARALVNRAVDGLPSFRSAREFLLTYHEITLHYRNSRMIYPPAHKSLSQAEQIVWRRLQTGTLISHFINSQIHQGDALPHCRLCSSPRADFNHMYRHCPNKPNPPFEGAERQERWEAALRSSRPDDQLRIVCWAMGVAEAQGLSAT